MSSNRSAELDAVVPANLAADVAAEWALCGDPLVGQLVGPYLVTRKLGEGGMGAVYEVVHRSLQRKAAMKVLRAHHAHSPEAAASRSGVKPSSPARFGSAPWRSSVRAAVWSDPSLDAFHHVSSDGVCASPLTAQCSAV